jgi:hypothetical protein
MYGLKPVPFTGRSFSATCKARLISHAWFRGLKAPYSLRLIETLYTNGRNALNKMCPLFEKGLTLCVLIRARLCLSRS